MRYIVVDLEATCWDDGTDRADMEIIEIGAVQLDSRTGPASREFQEFVRPIVHPTLSDFCRNLTTIRQEDVDPADTFPAVFARFVEWIGPERFTLCSWGGYDLNQLKKDCQRHGIPFPETLNNHINLKREFSSLKNVKPHGTYGALRILNLPPLGTHHRAIDDARNIARIAQTVLPELKHKF